MAIGEKKGATTWDGEAGSVPKSSGLGFNAKKASDGRVMLGASVAGKTDKLNGCGNWTRRAGSTRTVRSSKLAPYLYVLYGARSCIL
jgi:hypothetical protein